MNEIKNQKKGIYETFFKRLFDIVLSFLALVILSPFLLVIMIITAIAMKGNPFFIQERIGWHERKFKLIKFRTMANLRNEKGELLPDKDRLTKYGKVLRASSIA